MQENAKNWGAMKFRSLGMAGVADPKIHVLPHTCVTTSNVVVLRQTVYA